MTAEFDCPADAWFFEGSSNDSFMPYSILMEIALQTCGVLTTWNKAPLTLARTCNRDNILFRNLDATAKLIRNVDLRGETIRIDVDASEIGSELDAALNAIVALDMHTMIMPMAVDESLEELRNLFAPFVARGERDA